jgi:hypothetical protein
LTNALHLPPHRIAAAHAVCVQLQAHRLGVEIIEVDMNLKYVLFVPYLDLRFAEAQRRPSLIQSAPLTNNVHADFAIFASALKIA